MLLDGLFVLIGLLLLPIGFRRGLQREIVVTAALFVGAALSSSWARPWGSDLADFFNFSTGTGQFIVAAAFLLGAVVLLGYAGAAALHLEPSSGMGRLLGAFLAVVNGALVAAYLLRDVERFLADAATERSLRDSAIAWTLLRQFGWIVLALSLLITLPILFSLLSGRRESNLLQSEPRDAPAWSREERRERGRRRRLGWGKDDGKLEPVAAAAASPLAETMPIGPVDSTFWSVDRARPAFAGGAEWMQISADPAQPAPTRATAVRCTGCGERLRTEDLFCPRCGRSA
jgi:uncharacterized membrane protein required for colicin V production